MSNVAFKLFVVLGEAETDEARHIWERVAGHGWISCSEVWNGGNNIKHPINETLNFASSFFVSIVVKPILHLPSYFGISL